MEMAVAGTVARPEKDRTRISEEEAKKTVRKHDVATEYVEKWCRLGISKSVYVLSTELVRITRGCPRGHRPEVPRSAPSVQEAISRRSVIEGRCGNCGRLSPWALYKVPEQ